MIRVLVGIDRPDAAGKTTLADRLALACRTTAPTVTPLQASCDAFPQPRSRGATREVTCHRRAIT